METGLKTAKTSAVYINSTENDAKEKFRNAFCEYIKYSQTDYNEIVIVCIGSDRATGDSLGPLTGSKLDAVCEQINIKLYGTLDKPVHAKNISQTVNEIKSNHSNALVIAVDASLGNSERIGYVKICKGAIRPGAGVKKSLPEIGDFHITGIVNFSGVMDVIVLQTTKLSLVMRMADIISAGIAEGLEQLSGLQINPPNVGATFGRRFYAK